MKMNDENTNAKVIVLIGHRKQEGGYKILRVYRCENAGLAEKDRAMAYRIDGFDMDYDIVECQFV